MRRGQDPGSERSDEGAGQVGDVLRQRRLARGLTVDDVAEAIRFGARHVLAVENGRFDQLPPPPYGRGLVIAYAALVGVDPKELLRVSAPALAPARGGRRPRIFRTPLRERVTWRDWTVPFGLAAAALATVLVRAALTPEPVELVQPTAAVSGGAPPAAPRPGPAPAAVAAPDEAPPALGSPEPVAAPGVRVSLRCEGSTWVEAAVDGAEMRRYELGPGELLELTARERLAVSLGDAGVVRVRVGERELGFVGDKGETRTGMTFVAPRAAAPSAAVRAVDGD